MSSEHGDADDPTHSDAGDLSGDPSVSGSSATSVGSEVVAKRGSRGSLQGSDVVRRHSKSSSATGGEDRASITSSEKLRRQSQQDEEEGEDREEEEEEEDDKEEEEEEEQQPPHSLEVTLTPVMFADGLKLLCKIGNGLAHALVRLDAPDRGLTNIDILRCYVHLRYVDISRNKIRDVSPLGWLDHLLTVNADSNLLEDNIQLLTREYLQIASFADNKLTSLEGLNHPLIEHLNVNNNLISTTQELDPGTLSCIHTLELRGNRLTTTADIRIPTLKNLFLAANDIAVVEGMDELVNLTILHLRDNKIRSLNAISDKLINLQYLNARSNNISSLKLISKLRLLPNLRKVVLNENPISETDEYRSEVLVRIPQLDRLDKEEVTEDEKLDAIAGYEDQKEDYDKELLVQERDFHFPGDDDQDEDEMGNMLNDDANDDDLDLYDVEPEEVVVASSNIGSKSDIVEPDKE